MSNSNKENESHRERMQKRKSIQIKRLEERNKEKGLVIVFTGNGKGKTTAALGMAMRTIGHGYSIAVVQFIKGGWDPGEIKSFELLQSKVKWHALGGGFTWETQDKAEDQKQVRKAWEKSLDYLRTKKYKLVILDEINIALKLKYLSLDEVMNGIKERPPLTHVALTGRGAPERLIEYADLVTEMKLIHHPFKEKGIKAQKGIEF
tara:strand:+ start:620 stop:1234 length:615 start_codon:yes stop_codon:yes gene_type:complete